MDSNFRMYEKEYPSVNDLVIVHVNKITEVNAYVSLLEYNNKEEIILLSNLSRKRIRSISKLIYVGKTDVLQVIHVDKEKEYIDLSKKTITPDDIAKCKANYKKTKTFHNIMIRLASETKISLETLYQELGWKLYAKYGHAFLSLKHILDEENILDSYNITSETKIEFIKIIKHHLKSHEVNIQAEIELTCFSKNGIEDIKSALKAALELYPEIKIRLITSPIYSISVTTTNTESGIETINKAIQTITEKINLYNGKCITKVEPS